MKPKCLRILTAFFAFCCLSAVGAGRASHASTATVTDQVNWPEFLRRHDLVWEKLPGSWQEGAFLGNGLLGFMIYADGGSALRFDVGRSDVTDHRQGDGYPLVNKARLPIGHFLLTPIGAVTGGTMRLELWNAQAAGTISTDRGTIQWRAFVHAQEDMMVVEIDASEGEKSCRFDWVAAVAESSRPRNRGWPSNFKPNPPPTLENARGTAVCVQPLLEGGQYATARKQVDSQTNERRIYVSVGSSWPGMRARQDAVDAVEKAERTGIEALSESHRNWWHAYYPQSFLSLPDTRLESFYWIQMYKLASATRADRPAIDLMGPWYRKTIWPGMWWNLNIQLTYSPVYTANRLELGESFCRFMDNNLSNFSDNVKYAKGHDYKDDSAWVARVTSYDAAGGMFKGLRAGAEIGNLPWACHNYWRQCRYSADDPRLKERLMPLLRRTINFYLHMLEIGADGKYHLPSTYSPEFGVSRDCNYDLSLLRWGCTVLVESCERLKIDDPLLPKWKDVLSRLADFPADFDGYRIGSDQPFDKSHRHYSHLLMIYPLYLINWDQVENREVIRKSVEHWTEKRSGFAGFSYTGAASMYASMGRGQDALNFMNEFLDKVLEANTMYMEADSPVIESPLSGAQSLQDMVLQSWGGTIRVFPGVPDSWKDLAFHQLRAEGAFLVSAMRKEGRTQWVHVKSLAGDTCRIHAALVGQVHATAPLKQLGDRIYELDLKKGEEAILYTGAQSPVAEIAPCAAEPAKCNYFGTKSAANTTGKKKH